MDDDQIQDPQDDQDMIDPDTAKHEEAESPAVKGETDVFSGDMPEESADIDEEMEKIGKDIDPEHPEPLGEES